MKAQDIETKKIIFSLDLDKVFSKARKKAFQGDRSELTDFEDCYGFDLARVARNLDSSRYKRYKRVTDKVRDAVLSGTAYFVTLTFRDDVLATTTEETRRRLVTRYLGVISVSYIGNIDYGGEYGREHYHAIVDPLPFCLASWKNGRREYVNVPDLREWIEKYGFVTIEKIGSTEKDNKKVAKYTAKLSRHALKKSTEQGGKPPRLIFSRRKRSSFLG